MMDCLFCKIINKQAPGTILYQDETVTAFRDIQPAAPVHFLLVPNKHIASINDLTPEDEPVIGKLFSLARDLAAREGIDQGGYRVISNTGPNAGQAVFHLHFHLIGGQRMRYPMG